MLHYCLLKLNDLFLNDDDDGKRDLLLLKKKKLAYTIKETSSERLLSYLFLTVCCSVI